MNTIHPTALISEDAFLGKDNFIGPYTVINAGVKMGNNNWIGSHCILGAEPEDKKFSETKIPSRLIVEIGDNNVIREFGVIQAKTTSESSKIGSGCYIMAKVNIGHDCSIHDNVTISPGATIAGHVKIGFGATLGIGCSVHQNCEIGAYAMIGMNSVITKGIPPFTLVVNPSARGIVIDLNRIALERVGLEGEWMDSYLLSLKSNSVKLTNSMPVEVMKIITDWSNENNVKIED